MKAFFHSERSDLPDSRNLMGLQHPAVDYLMNLVLKADSPEDLKPVLSALDRVLLWEHVAIPNWYGNTHRVAYWNYLKHKDPHPRYGFRINTWWMEKDQHQ